MIKNLKRRNVSFSPPDMTEAEVNEVCEAILSGWITTGPRTKAFECIISEYCHRLTKMPIGHTTICLNSATAAMEMVLYLLGITSEDEVIVPAYTYTATASVTQHVGCKLVFVDSQNPSSHEFDDLCLEMDYDKLADAINEHTKLIVPVDLAGKVCDYDRIYRIVESKKALFHPSNSLQERIGRIVVAADSAHAFGAKWHGKMAGAIADFSSFSFHAVKNLTTAEGGALVWNLPFGDEKVDLGIDGLDYFPMVPKEDGETWNDLLYRICQLLSLHGQSKDALAKMHLGAWEYDVIGPWYKCNMTDIMSALGIAQFQRYPEMLARRKQMVDRMNESFERLDISVLKHSGIDFCSTHHLYIARLLGRTREEVNHVMELMAERGIATNVHYKPLPMMTAYKSLGFDIINYPQAYELYHNEITLPLHTKMNDDDLEYVIENFIDIVKASNK